MIIYMFLQPLLPGEKRQKEEWENLWVYGMGLNFILFLVVCIWKPDTRYDFLSIRLNA